ncbi:MAG: potassium transporter TrkG [bacterium]
MFSKYSPARILTIVFLGCIFLGTLLLYLPISQNRNLGVVSLLDCLFTATSAVCVTGLAVNTMSESFTYFGQFVILILIQLGGLGYMTLATLGAILFGRIPLNEKLVFNEPAHEVTLSYEGFGKFLVRAFKLILLIEAAGLLILLVFFLKYFSFGESFYHALFHSISGFCNAGFSSLPNGLVDFNDNYGLLSGVIFVSVCGCMGYVVLIEAVNYRKIKKLTLHSKMVILGLAIFYIIPAGLIFLSEFGNPETIGNMSLTGKIFNSIFPATVGKVAGFDTFPTGNFNNFTLFLMIFIMFVGGAPGGTAGGVKVTTFMVIFSTLWSTLKGRRDVNFFGRRIEYDIIKKSFTVIFAALLWISFATILMLSFEKFKFIDILFECVSAFNIVGLSTGITTKLGSLSKLIIIISMFLGRLGPLTIGVAVLKSYHVGKIRYPCEKVLVG